MLSASIPVTSGFAMRAYTKDNQHTIFENLDLTEIVDVEYHQPTTFQKLELKKIENVEDDSEEPSTKDKPTTKTPTLDSINIELSKKQTRLNKLVADYGEAGFSDKLWFDIFQHRDKDAYIEFKGNYYKFQNMDRNSNFCIVHTKNVDKYEQNGNMVNYVNRKGVPKFFSEIGNNNPQQPKKRSIGTLKLLNKHHALKPYTYSSTYKGFSIYLTQTSEIKFIVLSNPGVWLTELQALIKNIVDISNNIRSIYEEIADYIIQNDNVISNAAHLAREWREKNYVTKPIVQSDEHDSKPIETTK